MGNISLLLVSIFLLLRCYGEFKRDQRCLSRFLGFTFSCKRFGSSCVDPSFPTEASVDKEKTLAIIKPDGLFGNYTDKIKTIILESGFSILREMTLQLNESDVALFYAEHSGKSFFPSIVNYMTSPVSIMVLEKANAIVDWRVLIGPTDARKARLSHPGSIRAMCGSDLERNCVHGSDSPQSAAREIAFFFGEMSSGENVAVHDEL